MKCGSKCPPRPSSRVRSVRRRLKAPHVDDTRYYLNTYVPLVATAAGRAAALDREIPPFVDGSIRREPDLEHNLPSISCLCRGDRFAPRLRVGDIIAYMTKKSDLGTDLRHYRLTAVLKVLEVFDSHARAASWYRSHDLQLPNNCMVPGNPAKPLGESHRIDGYSDQATDTRVHHRWDAIYRQRARACGTFVVCGVLFRDLSWNAPMVVDEDLVEAFGRVPGTRNPGALPADDFSDFLCILRVSVTPSAP